jgi:hypothetical protein
LGSPTAASPHETIREVLTLAIPARMMSVIFDVKDGIDTQEIASIVFLSTVLSI